MSEFDIDAELANLLNAEQDRAPFYVELLEEERGELIALFQEHVITVYALNSEDLAVEQLFENSTDAEEREEDLYAQLDQLAAKDITRFEALLEGEMQVTGKGMYVLDFDGEGYPVEELTRGEAIRGKIAAYNIAPLVSEETSEAEGNLDMPGLWVTLSDAAVFGPAGNEVRYSKSMHVPMSMPGLKFGKVIRRFSEVVSETGEVSRNTPEELPPMPKDSDIREQLVGDMFRERCNEIENDLNYNDYGEIEDLQEARREYQAELNLYVGDIDPEEELTLTVTGAMKPMGGTIEIFAQKAYYNGPTIMKFSKSWRVVHGFSVCNGDTDEQQLVHVYPETVIAAFRSQ